MVYKDGYIIEWGLDFFLERKKSVLQFVKDLGFEYLFVNNVIGQFYVFVNEMFYLMLKGVVMGILIKIVLFIFIGLFFVFGKVWVVLDFVLFVSKLKEDQFLGEFFCRCVGDEVVENLIELLLFGIYVGDIDKLSFMFMFL